MSLIGTLGSTPHMISLPFICDNLFTNIHHKMSVFICTLQWRHNERDCVSSHQPHDCLPYRLFRRRSEKTSNLRVTGHCEGNSPVTSEFPSQRASNTENVSIWWRHHEKTQVYTMAADTQRPCVARIATAMHDKQGTLKYFSHEWWKIQICVYGS